MGQVQEHRKTRVSTVCAFDIGLSIPAVGLYISAARSHAKCVYIRTHEHVKVKYSRGQYRRTLQEQALSPLQYPLSPSLSLSLSFMLRADQSTYTRESTVVTESITTYINRYS